MMRNIISQGTRRMFAGLKGNSVSGREMELFDRLTGWWHPSGPSQILFVYNYHRIQFLRNYLNAQDAVEPLKGMDVLDVGCGAGFLSQSLTRLGGKVTGLDPNITSYNQAQSHKSTKKQLQNLTYINNTLQYLTSRQPAPSFDLITSMQVLEHVTNPQQFLQQLSSITKDGGLIMLSTIQRSAYSWLTHIVLAERVLGIVPDGTHHHNQFINVNECKTMVQTAGCEVLGVLELELGWKGDFIPTKGGSNYLMIARKKPANQAQNPQNPKQQP